MSVGMVLLWGQVLESVLGRGTKGQYQIGSAGYFSPWVPWRLMEAQGGSLILHMSSHMAVKDPLDWGQIWKCGLLQ